MILSHKHRYLFVHSRKTAGSSVVVALAGALGPEDLQLSALPETIAQGVVPPARVRREAWRTAPVAMLRSLVSRQSEAYGAALAESIKHRYSSVIGYKPQHASARDLREAFPTEWRDYCTFSIIRNPWDRMVSDYHWRCRGRDAVPGFATFVEALQRKDTLGGLVPVHLPSNWDSIAIDGNVAVDKVIRYENLEGELTDFLAEKGIPWSGELPRAKGQHRKRRDYRAIYDADTRGRVAEMFAEEIETFGYAF